MTRQRPLHPFPARMAPEIALDAIKGLQPGDIVLDPMTGSGTVLHHAAMNGFSTVGFDLDPLAILMTTVATQRVDLEKLKTLSELVLAEAKKIQLKNVSIPWIDNDEETIRFIKFWFAKKQEKDLRKFAFILNNYKRRYPNCIEIDVLRLALSRIIITKKIGASLAWDISHSRPHKVKTENSFDVFVGYENSIRAISKILIQQTLIKLNGDVRLSDARNLKSIPDNSIDQIITSPPYLNAIDYMRGHKFSLIWLGYTISDLRKIRSVTVGAEKKISNSTIDESIHKIYRRVLKNHQLSSKHESMVMRYIDDSINIMNEISRVLKLGKKATLVIGDSTLNGIFIRNSQVFREAGKLCGLSLKNMRKRAIPLNKRYLPVPKNEANSLSKRMKDELILTFEKSHVN